MKCKLKECRAQCCYNIPFADNELERFADKIVNKVVETYPIANAVMAWTVELPDFGNNRCPFLRHDYRCNIYEHRPDVCRKFGEIEQLPCKFRKN